MHVVAAAFNGLGAAAFMQRDSCWRNAEVYLISSLDACMCVLCMSTVEFCSAWKVERREIATLN
jgi:hypothetical protein